MDIHNNMRSGADHTRKPWYLFIVRIFQLLLAISYLTLLCYCGVHPGWWLNLQKPLGFGISVSIFTILLATHDILKEASATFAPGLLRNYELGSSLPKRLLLFLRIFCEFCLLGLWLAALVTMFLPKGKDFRQLFLKPPDKQWDCACVLAGVELKKCATRGLGRDAPTAAFGVNN